MITTRLLRRYRRALGAITALALAVAVVAPVTNASAGGTITQDAPLQGSVLVGNAFSDQLQVSGATGTVAFAQTSDPTDVAVSSSGQVSAPASLAAGSYSATGTDSDAAGDTGTWSYTLNVLEPAPSGFSGTIVGVYQSAYAVLAQLGQSSGVQTISQYQQTVSELDSTQLALFYSVVQQNPDWYQIPALMQTVASGLPVTSTATTLSTQSATSTQTTMSTQKAVSMAVLAKAAADIKTAKLDRLRAGTAPVPVNRARPPTGGIFAAANDPPVGPYTPASCPTQPDDASVFALEIALDVATYVESALSSAEGAATLEVGLAGKLLAAIFTLPAEVLVIALTLAHDTTAFAEQETVTDCDSGIPSGYIANIDNTTVQTYSLLTTVAGAITQLQTTETTTQQDAQAVESQLNTFQGQLSAALTNDTQAAQSEVGTDIEGVATQLQSDVNGLTGDVASVDSDLKSLNQATINQVNTDSTTVQTDLSSDVTQIMNDTDSDAQTLTTLIKNDNQQVLAMLQANFGTQQGQYYADLTSEIEDALAHWGNSVPVVQFMLPASQGGFLNSSPVGVQEVVTNDLKAMTALGAKITSAATADLNAANAALAAGQYLTAFQDYALSYEAFA